MALRVDSCPACLLRKKACPSEQTRQTNCNTQRQATVRKGEEGNWRRSETIGAFARNTE